MVGGVEVMEGTRVRAWLGGRGERAPIDSPFAVPQGVRAKGGQGTCGLKLPGRTLCVGVCVCVYVCVCVCVSVCVCLCNQAKWLLIKGNKMLRTQAS